jgi:hypothetical protein
MCHDSLDEADQNVPSSLVGPVNNADITFSEKFARMTFSMVALVKNVGKSMKKSRRDNGKIDLQADEIAALCENKTRQDRCIMTHPGAATDETRYGDTGGAGN